MEIPTWKESHFHEKNGDATPLELFISEYEPIEPDDESFRQLLLNALSDITATHHAEVARLTQELEAARDLLVEVDNQFAAEDFGKFGADVLDKVSAAVRLLEERERVTT